MGGGRSPRGAAVPPAARRELMSEAGLERLRSFTVPLRVSIRPCERDDLPGLEWFGLYTPHREIIAAAFDRQVRGTNLMLVAEANGFPVGQVWIDLEKQAAERV